MSFSFLQENLASKRRLATLVRRLSNEELTRSTSYGWTISALLAHLAFWDQRALVLLRRWKQTGVDASEIDSAAVNDALKPFCHALDPHAAVELCLSSAEAVDAELETITAELAKQIEASPTHFRFSRALHRNDHLDDIEKLLQPPQGSSTI